MPQNIRGRRNEMEIAQMVPLNRHHGISRESLGRYSERSIHSNFNLGGYTACGDQCRECMTRIPYATLIATIMCIVGVGVFCGTMYRGVTLSVLMFERVFHLRLAWLEAVKIVFVIIGASMGALGLMILFVGCLATGATRHKVYRAWGARVGGRISCAVFISITYILEIAWLLMLCFLVIVTLIFTIFWALCSSPRVQNDRQCIEFGQFDLRNSMTQERLLALAMLSIAKDLVMEISDFNRQVTDKFASMKNGANFQFNLDFMFPKNTPLEDMRVCDTNEIKMFCKDCVERAEVMFILASVSCLLVILSLVHYLICLSANYAHIRDHEKFQELQELQYLQDPEMSVTGSKDRF